MGKNNIITESLNMISHDRSLTAQIEGVLLYGELTKKDERTLSKLVHQKRRVVKSLVEKMKEFKPYESKNPRNQ